MHHPLSNSPANVVSPLKSLRFRPDADPNTLSSREFRAVCLAIRLVEKAVLLKSNSVWTVVASAVGRIVRTVTNSSEPYSVQKRQSSFPRRGYGY